MSSLVDGVLWNVVGLLPIEIYTQMYLLTGPLIGGSRLDATLEGGEAQ